jgi:hypothetical protein
MKRLYLQFTHGFRYPDDDGTVGPVDSARFDAEYIELFADSITVTTPESEYRIERDARGYYQYDGYFYTGIEVGVADDDEAPDWYNEDGVR